MPTLTLSVPDMTCDHCVRAVTDGVAPLPGVTAVEVDLATKVVTVTGPDLDRAALVAAIDDAGFDVAPPVDDGADEHDGHDDRDG